MQLSKKQTATNPLSKLLIPLMAMILAIVLYRVFGLQKYISGSSGVLLNHYAQPSNKTEEITQPARTLTYVNKIAGYSFQYTPYEEIKSVGGYGGPPEKSDTIIIVDKEDNNIALMDILIRIPPTCCNFSNEQEALQNIVDYFSSSTSQYLSPELNEVTGPIQTTVKVNNSDNQSTAVYQYDIAWQNDPKYSEGGNGVDVWLFIPTTVDWRSDPDRLGWFDNKFTFIWVAYNKMNEDRLQPILNSLTLGL
jgi:hypothetical protein